MSMNTTANVSKFSYCLDLTVNLLPTPRTVRSHMVCTTRFLALFTVPHPMIKNTH
jgi:hypothetical protein